METSKRIGFSIFNLLLVASFGVLMRYKIGFDFPYLNQKFLQEAHSHFAFFGWLTHTFFSLMVSQLADTVDSKNLKKYNWIINANLINAYAMLISFLLFGYNFSSIAFSTTAIFISFWFTYHYIKDCRTFKHSNNSIKWFNAALIFNILASFGTFALAYFMVSKQINQHNYLAAIYFYLHFEYNGWFFFSAIGLLHHFLTNKLTNFKENKFVFWLFALTCIPTYLLSILWLDLPNWLFAITSISSFLQFVAWILLLISIRPYISQIKTKIATPLYRLFFLVCIAVTIKFSLQLGSNFPSISKMAFGFRPIVIAYLHLVLLAILSQFVLIYLIHEKLITLNKSNSIGLYTLAIGIYLTEIALAIQGIAALNYVLIPFINEILFSLSLMMFSGILILFLKKLNQTTSIS